MKVFWLYKNKIKLNENDNNQDFIQILMNEGDYAPLYSLVLQSKLSDFQNS